MRQKRAVVWAVLGLFAGALLVASAAEARVGRGGSFGSRGSRSYSAPRPAPSTPGRATSPAAPERSVSPSPGFQRPGGLFGGLGGMVGGFLLGGLIGSLLFGGLGRGFGIGLMDVLLIAGLAYLAVALFRRTPPVPALAGAAPGAAGRSVARPEPTGGASSAGPLFGDDLVTGLAAVRTMDPGFDAGRFADVARDVFGRVQAAWTARDLGPVRVDLTDEMAEILEADLARLRSLRRANRLEKLVIQDAEVTEAWQEYGHDFVTVRFRASVLDYTVDEASGAVVEGSAGTPTAFTEFWTFTRLVGATRWRLSAVQQPGPTT
jgi:predicted lipid-binding transport protein (Tim44 family)